MTTLHDLLNPRTREGWRTELLARLASLGFRPTTWASGSTPRTLVELIAWGLADGQAAVAMIAAGGLLDLASRGWLTLLAQSHYRTDRVPAGFTEGEVEVTCAPGSGPYTLSAGAFWVGIQADGATDAVRFVSTQEKTVNPGQTVRVPVKAESPGARFNAANGAITYLFTPLPGLTVANPAIGATGTWTTVPGLDEEDDVALRARCRARWASLSQVGATDLWYELHARSATSPSGTPAGATRVAVIPGPGDGTLRVIVASAAGVLGPSPIAWIQAYVDRRKPPTDAPTAASATAVAVALVGTLYVSAADNTPENQARVLAAITALQEELTIGQPIDEARVKAVIYGAQPGLRDLDLTLTADVAVGSESIAVFDVSGLVWSSV